MGRRQGQAVLPAAVTATATVAAPARIRNAECPPARGGLDRDRGAVPGHHQKARYMPVANSGSLAGRLK
jgi:hypothetical protein